MADTGTLVLRRSRAFWRDRLARYQVLIDDHVIGSVKNGQVGNFLVEPGEHRLRLRVMGKYSHELGLALAVGDVAAFDCGPAGSTFSALYNAVFRRDTYISLRPAS